MKARPSCALCGAESFGLTTEPVIVDCPRSVFLAANRTHPTVLRHGRRVIGAGRPLCSSCNGVTSFLPAVSTAVAA